MATRPIPSMTILENRSLVHKLLAGGSDGRVFDARGLIEKSSKPPTFEEIRDDAVERGLYFFFTGFEKPCKGNHGPHVSLFRANPSYRPTCIECHAIQAAASYGRKLTAPYEEPFVISPENSEPNHRLVEKQMFSFKKNFGPYVLERDECLFLPDARDSLLGVCPIAKETVNYYDCTIEHPHSRHLGGPAYELWNMLFLSNLGNATLGKKPWPEKRLMLEANLVGADDLLARTIRNALAIGDSAWSRREARA